jgi:acyl carrier protein
MTDPSAVLTSDAVERDLRVLVAELAELDLDDVGVDVPFHALGIDSLLAMEIAVHVEERFRIVFEEKDVKGIETIGQMIVAVMSRSDSVVRAR